jgi:CRP-like cAMP-binding protein
MSVADRALLDPYFEPMKLRLKQVLYSPNAAIEHLYFLEEGLASVVAETPDGRRLEIGIYGREGMGTTAILLGDDQCAHEHFIQMAGSGFRLPANILIEAVDQSSSLEKLLLKYLRCFQLQVTQTALANGNFSLEERLARWLLMCHDRVDGDELPLTHEFLGIMLAVRRSGVTLALQIFEGAKIIKAKRGCVVVLNRPKLEEIAGGSYGPAEAAYERLIGPLR